ncbi:MAG: hypothetical protein FWG84_10295 [Bacteroidales bacterium]|nr:hypothetical protein [Bacteroidales bacterium]
MNNYTYIQQTIKSEAGDLFTGEKIISVNKRMLILGAAGSGKTTLCQYLYDLMYY